MYLSGGDLSLGHYLYPHMTTFQHPLSEVLSKCWIYFNLYLAPFRMPVFFISGYLIRRYIDSVPWGNCLDKRIWNIFWVLALWGVVQWLALSALNQWLAPERDLSNASNAAYADSTGEFLHRDDHRQHQLVVSVCVNCLFRGM